jgi:SPP1 family predicted phage head-tail adaptor
MNIGPLDNRIELQERTVTPDSTTGQDVVSWSTIATVWANVQDVLPSKAEKVVSGSIEVSVNRTRVRIRYREDIDSSYRLKALYPVERYLQIVSGKAQIGGRKAFLEFMCEEISTLG